MSKNSWYHNNVPVPPRSDSWKRSPSKKNTKDWCHGKVGVPHSWDIRHDRYTPRTDITCGWRQWEIPRGTYRYYFCKHERYCTVCGKIPSGRDRFKSEECPDWVPFDTVIE